ncbi:hypothetical protein BHM03_00035010 [Ensete ventricosum]|nr:hypothetical protein BHM03_00035010 [Ensete ventricosum]
MIGSFAEEDVGTHGINMPSAVGAANASRGLEVAVGNLQDYCNARFAVSVCIDIPVYDRYETRRHLVPTRGKTRQDLVPELEDEATPRLPALPHPRAVF